MSPTRILVARSSALGDVVLATSVLDPLRERFPDARIEWVTARHYAPLLEGLPELERVHALESGSWRSVLALREEVRGRFDVAIDLQHKVKSALLCAAAAPLRVRFSRRTAGQAVLALLGRDPPLASAHATRLYAAALAPLGITSAGSPRVHLTPAARARAGEVLRGARRPCVAIAPGARWATKRWPPERFAAVADALAAEGASVVLAGGPADAAASAEVRAHLRAPLAADLSSLSIEALAAALAEVDLVVSGDSGLAHLGGAVGTPALVLFGPTSSVRWAPAPPGRALSLGLPCSPCSNHGGEACPLGHHRCLGELSVSHVVNGARELLAGARSAPPPLLVAAPRPR